VNSDPAAVTASVELDAAPYGITQLAGHVSSDGALWQPVSAQLAGGQASVTVPGYGVMTLVGAGSAPSEPPDAGTTLPEADAGMPAPADAGHVDDPGAAPGVHGTGCTSAAEPPGLIALLLAALALRRRRQAA